MSDSQPVISGQISPEESSLAAANSRLTFVARRTREELRALALSDGPEREMLLANHPLNQRPVKVLTRSIRETFLATCEAIKFKRPGCAFMADCRVGKSTAAVMIKDKLPESIPNVAYAIVSAKAHELVTERVFWGDILIALGLPIHGTAQERQERVRGAVITSCIEADGTQFCLFIDEGQNWKQKEFTLIRDLSNQLTEPDRYTFTTVTWGDLKLDELSAEFRVKRKDLWGRFLMKPAKFLGIRDLPDLQFFLKEHDNLARCEYPAGSGVSYTEFFMPKAYGTGWRLEHEATALWNALVRAAAKVNREVADVGMQWVGESVIHFLEAGMSADTVGFKSASTNWDEAVALSRFLDSLI